MPYFDCYIPDTITQSVKLCWHLKISQKIAGRMFKVQKLNRMRPMFSFVSLVVDSSSDLTVLVI